MHNFNKTNRVFSKSDKRNIRNVRNILRFKKTLTNRLTSRSILNISKFNFVFVNFL